jgi:hypothetical protein
MPRGRCGSVSPKARRLPRRNAIALGCAFASQLGRDFLGELMTLSGIIVEIVFGRNDVTAASRADGPGA